MRYIRLSTLILGHRESLIDVSNFIMIEKINEIDQNLNSKNDKVKRNEYLFFLCNFSKYCIKLL